MRTYDTDNDQKEMVKKWWADYGKWVLMAVLVGLAAGFSWRYWQEQQVRSHQQASLLYQQLIVADGEANASTVMQMSAEITRRYPKSEYAALGNLVAAKNAVAQTKLDVAALKLQWTMDNSKDSAIRQIARLRKARVLLTLNQTAEAQKLLTVVDDKTFLPAINEVQGDIYSALHDYVKASQSYQAAQAGLSTIAGEDMLLSMKLTQPKI